MHATPHQHVAIVYGDRDVADAHDFAQSSGKHGLPSHCVGVVEPALRERRRVEQQAIDVDQLAASSRAKLFDHVRELGMVLLLDEGYASHGSPISSRAKASEFGATTTVGMSFHLEAGCLDDRQPACQLIADDLMCRVRSRVEDRLEA